MEARGVRYHLPRGAGGAEVVAGEDAGVGRAELNHEVLFIVVGHQSNVHDDCFLSVMSLQCWGGIIGFL